MNMRRIPVIALLLAAGLALGAASAGAAPISIMIGDNDGHGFGAAVVPDGGALPNINLPEDHRSGAEAAAVNGAQQTDFYSAVFTPLPFSVDVIFPLASAIDSGTLTVDMGGFQASTFGQLGVSFNGIAQPNLFNFEDGAFSTAVRHFVLSPAAVAAANLAGQFVVSISRGNSDDAISFDYFRLDANTVPEPATLLLFGAGAIGVASRIRRVRAQQ